MSDLSLGHLKRDRPDRLTGAQHIAPGVQYLRYISGRWSAVRQFIRGFNNGLLWIKPYPILN